MIDIKRDGLDAGYFEHMAERLEIVKDGFTWLLSDHHHAPRRFATSSEAIGLGIEEAKRLKSDGVSAEVFIWREGKTEKVFP